jgi:hypothetical protein
VVAHLFCDRLDHALVGLERALGRGPCGRGLETGSLVGRSVRCAFGRDSCARRGADRFRGIVLGNARRAGPLHRRHRGIGRHLGGQFGVDLTLVAIQFLLRTDGPAQHPHDVTSLVQNRTDRKYAARGATRGERKCE